MDFIDDDGKSGLIYTLSGLLSDTRFCMSLVICQDALTFMSSASVETILRDKVQRVHKQL